jgi:hypothetical protein
LEQIVLVLGGKLSPEILGSTSNIHSQNENENNYFEVSALQNITEEFNKGGR